MTREEGYGRLRLATVSWFTPLADVIEQIERWRVEYNESRRRRALGEVLPDGPTGGRRLTLLLALRTEAAHAGPAIEVFWPCFWGQVRLSHSQVNELEFHLASKSFGNFRQP